ncbi:hypothetical protein AMTR_s00023p00252110 [Amborella trichopoda]|uniref:Uncharacterized protein n=1 Tax=Amborella trichopoda TaxID=13333 RepID=W1NKM7_AMBTC|nr:hypothetical protein AMTR_s00023p00252110 [Amborella trichopoda]
MSWLLLIPGFELQKSSLSSIFDVLDIFGFISHSFASFSATHPSIAFVGEDVDPYEGDADDPTINGELVPPDFQGWFEILETKFKAVHKILKVIRPESKVVHPKMITSDGDSCWSVFLFMVVACLNDLGNFNVQCLSRLPICPAGGHLLGSLLIVAPLTTIWFFDLNQW